MLISSVRHWCISALAPLLVGPALLTHGTPPKAPRWYDEGHRLVARLAESRLTPRAAAAIHELLSGESLAAASSWADQIRGQRRETAPLHYVNIPLGSDAYRPERDCPGGRCIIAAIERDRLILADSSAGPARRAEALRFLVHFIGDLHQPLHVASDGDRGGNDRHVTLLGRSRNLHEVWDGELLDVDGVSESGTFEELRRTMRSLDLTALERGTVVDWAMEGHRIAAEHAYRLPRDGALGRPYVRLNRPRVDRALIAAGVRLALVLNQALAGYTIRRDSSPPTVFATHAGTGPYTDREAAAHVGETVTVTGTVVSVHRTRGGNVFLNFGADHPHQTFSGAVLQPRGGWDRSLDSLAGKRIGISGRIVRYRGGVGIVIERADQIQMVR